MNTTILAAEIVSLIPAMAKDSITNNEQLLRNMLDREQAEKTCGIRREDSGVFNSYSKCGHFMPTGSVRFLFCPHCGGKIV
jgi:hypothetical protein